MRGIVRRFVTVLLVFCLAWVVSGGSMATAAVVMPDVTEEIVSLATRAQPFMQRNQDGTYTLTASAKDLKVSQLAVDRFSSALDAVNEGIRAGYLTTDAQGQVKLTDTGRLIHGVGEAQSNGSCVQKAKRLTVNETSRFEGLLNMYSAGSVGILAIITFVAAVVTGWALPLAALALVTAILGTGAYFFASWMQSVDRGSGVTINWWECDRGAGPVVGNVWPTGN